MGKDHKSGMFHLAHSKSPAIIALLCALSAHPALAGTSRWEEADGARLRIVTEEWRPGMKTLRGALQVELEPGWKTYWREPGSAGIPPQVTRTDAESGSVIIHFPVPEWVDDEYGSWAGYKHPVALPLTFSVSPDQPPHIAADIFLGVCRDICVPVAASLDIPPGVSSGAALQTILVDAAFAELPGANSDALSIGDPAWTPDGMLEIRVGHADGDGDAGLFLSAGVEHPFAKPAPVSVGGGTTVFHAKPLFDALKMTESADVVITAKHGSDATEVETRLPVPK